MGRHVREARAHRYGWAIALVLVAWSGSMPLASAQDQAAPAEPSLMLRPPAAYTGEELRAPLYVEGTGGPSLPHVRMELRFPAQLMTFVGVEVGFLLQAMDAKVQTRTDAEKDGTTALFVDITSPKAGVPDGLILYLKFRVSESAPPGGEIPLRLTAMRMDATAAAGSGKSMPFTADPLRVSPRKKEDEFQFACFFYMH
jgi:hypothetical protein